jgi:SAM-dependent methyltransferase
MDPMPLAGQFCATLDEARAAERYPLTWVLCARCALVQVLEDIDDRKLFAEYNYASSSVPGLVRHFEAYASWLTELLGSGPKRLLEIGCNDGVLLSRLPRSWHLLGVDPSDVAARVTERSYDLVAAPFTAALADDHADKNSFDLVTGSNCLAHIRDLKNVFEGVSTMLRADGLFVLEVHDLEATLRGSQWDTIYHEHKAEWSLESLQNCLVPLGFAFERVELLALHGGLLRAVFRKSGSGREKAPARPRTAFDGLRRAYEARRDTPLYRRIRSEIAGARSVAAYGASGRANVWLNQHPELAFRYIVDDAPLRMHKFIPAVGTPIVPSRFVEEDPPDALLITAWNHAPDIRRKHPGFRGDWLQTFSDGES